MTCDQKGTVYWVDRTKGVLGSVNLKTAECIVLASGLRSPERISYSGGKCYFCEVGTEKAKYKDGRLAVFDIESKHVTVLLDGLEFPSDLVATDDGDLYYIEAAGGSTSFGGRERISVLPAGTKEPRTILDTERISGLTCLTLTAEGKLLVGLMGRRIPGNTGHIVEVDPRTGRTTLVASRIPAPVDLQLGRLGRLFIAMCGRRPDGSAGRGATIGELRLAEHKLDVWKSGVSASCIATDESGVVYYAHPKPTSGSCRIISP